MSPNTCRTRMEVREFNVQMIPALAIETVCCSIASWSTERVVSDILSNSSMQHTPLSLRTRAPLSRTDSLVSSLLVLWAQQLTWIFRDVGSQTHGRASFSGGVNASRSDFVHVH